MQRILIQVQGESLPINVTVELVGAVAEASIYHPRYNGPRVLRGMSVAKTIQAATSQVAEAFGTPFLTVMLAEASPTPLSGPIAAFFSAMAGRNPEKPIQEVLPEKLLVDLIQVLQMDPSARVPTEDNPQSQAILEVLVGQARTLAQFVAGESLFQVFKGWASSMVQLDPVNAERHLAMFRKVQDDARRLLTALPTTAAVGAAAKKAVRPPASPTA